ncbi:Hypothetical_protein [Hexamita inflata]|uniref:Hypothetical_protein n=1 Tax=Hexamita inflata TaxID=28002 RepID=A0AA86QNV0_9EUKA|nr:Hypothetical protein HINF_LOCUS45067 [Hexamita inflata]
MTQISQICLYINALPFYSQPLVRISTILLCHISSFFGTCQKPTFSQYGFQQVIQFVAELKPARMNQGAINIQKQVVVNNFNCSNTSLSGQSKSQSTNKSEVARKSQNQQNPKQTAPKQVSQTKTPVQKPKEAPQAPLPQETKKTQSQIPLAKSKHTSETTSQSSTARSFKTQMKTSKLNQSGI